MAPEPSPPPEDSAPWELRFRRLDNRVWVDAQALVELLQLRQAILHRAALSQVKLKYEYLSEGLDYVIGLLEKMIECQEST